MCAAANAVDASALHHNKGDCIVGSIVVGRGGNRRHDGSEPSSSMVKPGKMRASEDMPIANKLRKRKLTKSQSRVRCKVLRMLSQEHSESEPEASGCASRRAEASGSGALTIPIPGGSGGGGGPGADGGAVTPGGFVNGEGTEEFLSTGRTGRRNAMPDILGKNAETGTADLPDKLEALTTDPSGPRGQPEPGPSSQQQAG